MDEQRILKLIKAASELEAFEAEMTGRDAEWTTPPVRARRFPRWLAVAVPIAAALALFFLLPPSLSIREFSVAAIAQRSVDTESKLEITIELNRPAFVRVVLIDERLERWIMPLVGAESRFVKRIGETETLSASAYPNPGDPRGAARATVAMIVVSAGETPTAQELIEAIPDPIAAAGADGSTLHRTLEELAAALHRRFDCLVQFRRIP